MDNLTHSLIGLIAGDCVARTTAGSSGPHSGSSEASSSSKQAIPGSARRTVLLLLFIVGGNLPDLDLLLTYKGFGDDPLRYVIQHRGYTHTIVGCLALALLMYACVELWARRRHLALSRKDRALFASMAVSGTLLHLGMDFLNSYGVHPLWPWYNGWFYGDSIFIIEPLYWLAATPLIVTVRSAVTRILLMVATLCAAALTLLLHPHQTLESIGVIVLAAVLYVAGRLGTPRSAAAVSGLTAAAVTLLFVIEGQVARQVAEDVVARDLSGQRFLDHVLTPVPTNPYCWDALLISTDSGLYHVTHGMLTTAPRYISALDCPAIPGRDSATTAPLAPVAASASREVRWLGQFTISEEHLRRIAMTNCETMELMQFVRAPFAAQVSGEWVLGDLRFDRGTKTGMAQIVAQPLARMTCRRPAPWLPPRLDLF
jgi:inner membrane protein